MKSVVKIQLLKSHSRSRLLQSLGNERIYEMVEGSVCNWFIGVCMYIKFRERVQILNIDGFNCRVIYLLFVCGFRIGARRWIVKLSRHNDQKLRLIFTAIGVLGPYVYQLGRGREGQDRIQHHYKDEKQSRCSLSLPLTWVIFQPSESVDNICVSSPSWQWRTR